MRKIRKRFPSQNMETDIKTFLAPEEIAMLLTPQPAKELPEGYLGQLASMPPRRLAPLWQRGLASFAAAAENALKSFCCRSLSVSVAGFGKRLSSMPDCRCAMIFESQGKTAEIILGKTASDNLLACMLGGTPSGLAERQNGCSALEKALLTTAAAPLAKALGALNGESWRFVRLEENLAMPAENQIAVTADLRFAFDGRPAKFSLFLSPGVLPEPMAEKGSRNPRQRQFLSGAAEKSVVELKAVLAETGITLAQLEKLGVGSYLPLNMAKDGEISLYCGNNEMFGGIMGRKGRQIAVKITKVIEK